MYVVVQYFRNEQTQKVNYIFVYKNPSTVVRSLKFW